MTPFWQKYLQLQSHHKVLFRPKNPWDPFYGHYQYQHQSIPHPINTFHWNSAHTWSTHQSPHKWHTIMMTHHSLTKAQPPRFCIYWHKHTNTLYNTANAVRDNRKSIFILVSLERHWLSLWLNKKYHLPKNKHFNTKATPWGWWLTYSPYLISEELICNKYK